MVMGRESDSVDNENEVTGQNPPPLKARCAASNPPSHPF